MAEDKAKKKKKKKHSTSVTNDSKSSKKSKSGKSSSSKKSSTSSKSSSKGKSNTDKKNNQGKKSGKKPFYKEWWFWLVIAIVIVIIVIAVLLIRSIMIDDQNDNVALEETSVTMDKSLTTSSSVPLLASSSSLAVSETSESTVADSNSADTPSDSNSAEADTANNNNLTVGERGKIGQIQYTLTSATLTDERNDLTSKKPKNVLKIDYTVENGSDADIPTGFDIQVFDSAGTEMDHYPLGETNSFVSPGHINDMSAYFELETLGKTEIKFIPDVNSGESVTYQVDIQ